MNECVGCTIITVSLIHLFPACDKKEYIYKDVQIDASIQSTVSKIILFFFVKMHLQKKKKDYHIYINHISVSIQWAQSLLII